MKAFFDSYNAINEAELDSFRSGLTGNIPVSFFHALEKSADFWEVPALWCRFACSARKFRNIAAAVRALELRAQNADEKSRSLCWLTLGHYFRFVAFNHIEAAKAYANSASDNFGDKLCAFVALYRLHRADPQCREISEFLDEIQNRCALSVGTKEMLEKMLAALPLNEHLTRAQLLAELAMNYLIEWGDAGSAFECLSNACSLDDKNGNIAPIASAIVKAMPDNVQIVRRGIQLLEKLQDFTALDDIAQVCEFLPFEMADACLLLLSEVYAFKLNQPHRASYFLYRCALQNPSFWADAVIKQTWICKFAAECSEFRTALVECLKHINDEKLSLQIFAYIARFATEPSARIQAMLWQVRIMINSGLDEKALDTISGAVQKFELNDSWGFYDLLFELIQKNFAARNTAWNAQILHIADNLCKNSRNSDLYIAFLQNFFNILSSQNSTSEDALSLLNSIRFRLEHRDRLGESICLSVSPENTPILASCLELIRNQQWSQALKVFFDWNRTGAEFDCALLVLGKIDAAIWDISEISREQVEALSLNSENVEDISRVVALAILISSDDEKWSQIIDRYDANVLRILEILLRYLPWLQERKIEKSLIQKCLNGITSENIAKLLHEYLPSCMMCDVLWEQVIEMADADPNALLEEMDRAIEEFPGDAIQKAKLYAQKYRYAEQIGNERVMLNSLRDILEINSTDEFAVQELRLINPESLKPHAQILYYQLRIFIETAPDERLRNQAALAVLYTKTSQLNNAITLYHTIIDEHPDNLDARYHLLDLLLSLENWKSAENVLLALVNVETSPENRYQTLVRLAILQGEHMMMPSRALLTFFAALDTDPRKLNALHSKLCDISEKLHSFSALLDKYEDFALHSEDYDIRKTATRLLAKVYSEQIHNPALACNVLDEFYSRGGMDDIEFLRFASDFYSNSSNWNKYVLIIGDLFRLSQDKAEKINLALNVAHVYSNQLNDIPHTAKYLDEAVRFVPQKTEQWIDIADLYIGCNMAEKAVEPLLYAADTEPDVSKKCAIMLETARLFARLERLEEAARCVHSSMQYKPTVELLTPVIEELIAITTVDQNEEVFNVLCSDLVSVCADVDKTPLLLQQALTLVRVYDDKDTAQSLIQNNVDKFEALDLDQSLMLLQVLTQIGNSDDAIRIADSIVQNFELDNEQSLTCLNSVLACAVDTSNTELIKSTAEQIVSMEPDNAQASFRLIQLDYQSGRWDQAVERINRLLPSQERLTAENAMLMHYYYGEILHAAERDEDAIYYLNDAIAIRGDFRPAVDLKLAILLSLERWREALPVFEQLIELTTDDEVIGAIHKRIAEVYHFYLDDPENALIEYEKALTLGGDVEDVPVRLLSLYQKLELWQKAAMTAQILAQAQVNSPSAKCDFLLVFADIQKNQLYNAPEAVNAYLEAFTTDPSREDCVKPLTQMLVLQRDWDNVCGIVEHLASLVAEQPDRVIPLLEYIAGCIQNNAKCKKTLENAEMQVRKIKPDVRLIGIESNELDISENEIVGRRRITTAPHGMLTIDSSLLRNPEIQPMPKNSQQSVMAVSDSDPTSEIDIAQEQILELPDDAILPVEDKEDVILPTDKRNDIKDYSETGSREVSVVETAQKLSTSDLVPSLSSRSSSNKGALKTFENLSFTADDILEIGKDARGITRFVVDDLLDIASVEHPEHEPLALPASISETVESSLATLAGNKLNPGLVKLLSTLASEPESPALKSIGLLNLRDVQNLPDNLRERFDCLRNLFRCSHVVLKALPLNVSYFVGNTTPPSILFEPAHLSTMTMKKFIARMTFALVLTRPEYLLCSSMSAVEVHQQLINASASMSLFGSSDIDKDLAAQYKSVLSRAGFVAVRMPRISADTLSIVKQHSLNAYRNAIMAALVMSQSLIDCLMILTEIENMRFPTTLSTLKSAMKRSALIKDLVIFSLGNSALNIFDKVYK